MNPILLILLVVVIIGLAAVLYFTFFNASTPTPAPTPETPDTPETPVAPQITLTDIVNNFNNHSSLQNLKDLGYNSVAKVENNSIVIDVTEISDETIDDEAVNDETINDESSVNEEDTNMEELNVKQYVFQIVDRNLTFTLNNDDEIYYNLYLILIDSIGMTQGLEENEVISLLTSIDLTVTNISGITINQIENGMEVTVNIDTKIDTSSLKTMYIEVGDLEEYRDFLEGTGTVPYEKGNLIFHKEGNDNITTILIGEKNNNTNLTYNSILSVVELLYPDDLENFKTSYPNLETISFNRYTITLNYELTGDLETQYNQYKDDYKFILIQINKNI